MFDVNDLKKLLKENSREVAAVIESERYQVIHSPRLKILHSIYLAKFWKERPNKALTFAIYFDENLVDLLNFESIESNLIPITEELKSRRLIEVTEEFQIISSSAATITETSLKDLSKGNKVLFFFGEEGIDTMVRGDVFDRINIFYDETDRLRYSKKYNISELQTCLKDYEKYIMEPGNNQAFFASKKLIAKLQPENTPNNTLHNKPEKILRDNLISFLNRFTQHSFLKENELNNLRELDLYSEFDGKKYLIEVKWLGHSINDDDTGLSKKITDYSAREGVTQTLEYIHHLINEMSFNVHVGYLCVFDAREETKKVNYDDFKFVTANLMPYYKNHFVKLDEIRLVRLP